MLLTPNKLSPGWAYFLLYSLTHSGRLTTINNRVFTWPQCSKQGFDKLEKSTFLADNSEVVFVRYPVTASPISTVKNICFISITEDAIHDYSFVFHNAKEYSWLLLWNRRSTIPVVWDMHLIIRLSWYFITLCIWIVTKICHSILCNTLATSSGTVIVKSAS